MKPDRIFHVIWVGPNHGCGIASSEKADGEVRCLGDEIVVRCPHSLN